MDPFTLCFLYLCHRWEARNDKIESEKKLVEILQNQFGPAHTRIPPVLVSPKSFVREIVDWIVGALALVAGTLLFVIFLVLCFCVFLVVMKAVTS